MIGNNSSTYILALTESEEMTEAARNSAETLDGTSVSLDEALKICRDLGCHAQLLDEPGFVVGWVHPDGTYRLK